MGHKTLIDGVGYDIIGGRCLVDGVGYSIQKGRTLEDGVGYDVAFGPSGPVAGDVTVGSSVYANYKGTRTEFLVVHQGLPSSMYDASCDGTWLLAKTLPHTQVWSNTDSNDYKASHAHSFLNETFAGNLDANVLNKVRTVKIPYVNGNGNTGSVASGENGLSTKFFLLSAREMYSGSYSNMAIDGSVLDYFLPGTAASDAKRIAYNASGKATNWWTRTPNAQNNYTVFLVYNSNGSVTNISNKGNVQGIRPAFILDSGALIDPDTFDILG